jgi:hypothetical protein
MDWVELPVTFDCTHRAGVLLISAHPFIPDGSGGLCVAVRQSS